jgi:hypothetical protein
LIRKNEINFKCNASILVANFIFFEEEEEEEEEFLTSKRK